MTTAPMDFLACTKDGIIIYDAMSAVNNGDGAPSWKTGKTAEGLQLKVIAKIPSPSNAFGHTWSADGDRLASVNEEGNIRLYDSTKGYEVVLELPRVAPDVDGRTGGVRKVTFSPLRNYLVSYEKWDPIYPDNVHVWALEGEMKGKKVHTTTLKGYTSGNLPLEVIAWTSDEATAIELVPGKGLVLREPDFSEEEGKFEVRQISEKLANEYKISPISPKGINVCVYTPEQPSGMAGRIAIYDLAAPEKKASCEMYLPGKVKEAKIMWNCDGTALLVSASSDVDESGCSYFGTTYLYWMKPDSKTPTQLYGSKDGQVQDLAWSPCANEFLVIVGFPGIVNLHDGKTGKLNSEIGKARRNTLKWNRWGKFVAVGGFGTMAGDLDFFDRSKEETVASLRAPLTVDCAFGPDGRHFLACTVAPRMNEGNQISMYRYTGELLFKMHYVPEVIDARHEDTGAGARTKTQALLYAASWRPQPNNKEFEDRPASPPRGGARRKKGLPDGSAAAAGSATDSKAYKPRGAEGAGNAVAAMMRGEIPDAGPSRGWGGPEAPTLKPMEDWEIKKLQKEARAKETAKEKADAEAKLQAQKDFEKSERGDKKKLKVLEDELAELEILKEKDWDELTEEDEEKLDREVEMKQEIAKLKKMLASAA